MSHSKIISFIFISLLLNACGGSAGNTNTTNTSNKLVTQVLIDYGNNGEIDTIKDYEYDENGNLLFLRTDTGNDGDYDTVMEYAYDNQNNRIKQTRWIDKARIRAEEVLKTYDSNNNMLTNDITDYLNGFSEYNTYTYSGNKIATRRITSSDDTSIYTYFYTGNVLDIHQDINNDGELDYIETINYDGKGNIIQSGMYNPDGTLSTSFTGEIQTFSYDEHQNILISGTLSGTIHYRHTYTYDSNGNMLTHLFQPTGGTVSFLTYLYD